MVMLSRSGKGGRPRGRVFALILALGAAVPAATAEMASAVEVADVPAPIQRLIEHAQQEDVLYIINKGGGLRLAVWDDVITDERLAGGHGAPWSRYRTQEWVLVETKRSAEGYFGVRNVVKASTGEAGCLQPRSGVDPVREEDSVVRYCGAGTRVSSAQTWQFRYNEDDRAYELRPAGNTGLVLGVARPNDDLSKGQLFSGNRVSDAELWRLREG